MIVQVGSPEIHKEKTNSEHPSEEMLECLRQIGELTARHEAVAEEVSNLMKNQEQLKGEVVRVEGQQQTAEKLNQQLMKRNEGQELFLRCDLYWLIFSTKTSGSQAIIKQ